MQAKSYENIIALTWFIENMKGIYVTQIFLNNNTWLPLSPHTKYVLSSYLLATWGLSVWCLQVKKCNLCMQGLSPGVSASSHNPKTGMLATCRLLQFA